jgi:outer membrane protein OmpA-like peptidoglycan-associated protein
MKVNFMLFGGFIAVLLLSACAANDPYRRTKTGAGVGAVAGAVLGHQIDDDLGAAIGAAVGALAGGGVGNYMDRQQRAFEQALADERQRNNLEIQRLRDGSLKLDIPSEVSFDFDSASIKPIFTPTLDKVGNILRQYDRTVVHVIGHTDSVGSDSYNLQLSQRRANNVADFLASQGVVPQRLRTEGRGERQPRASNADPQGRELNRRVELFIKPIVEGQEHVAYQSPGNYHGGSPTQDYRRYPEPRSAPQGYGGYPQSESSQGPYDYPPPPQRY